MFPLSIRLLRTEKGDVTDYSDIARAVNTFFIEQIEHMAVGIDNEAGQSIQNEQRIMVPQFHFTPVDERTVMDLLWKFDVFYLQHGQRHILKFSVMLIVLINKRKHKIKIDIK